MTHRITACGSLVVASALAAACGGDVADGPLDQQAAGMPVSESDLASFDVGSAGAAAGDSVTTDLCDCTNTSRDPDCDYSYIAGAECVPNTYDEWPTALYMSTISAQNDSTTDSLLLSCQIHTTYWSYEGYSVDHIKQVKVYAYKQPSAGSLYVYFYSQGIDALSPTMRDSGYISAGSSSIQTYELEGFTVSSGDQLSYLVVSLPKKESGYNGSAIYGMRICYDTDL